MIIHIFTVSVLAKPLNNAQIVRGVFCYTHLNMANLMVFGGKIKSRCFSAAASLKSTIYKNIYISELEYKFHASSWT